MAATQPYEATAIERRASAPRKAFGTRGDAGVVIVGAGRAGWQMAQALRERDADLPITLVAACDASVYDKPLLSVALARGLVLSALVKEPAASAAQRLNVRLLPRTHAVSVSSQANTLRTTRGSLRYRHLVLAHGAEPREVAQLPAALCWRINHLDAYLKFRARLGGPNPAAPQRVLIAGAGLVGCELANDLALAGHPVTLLDVNLLPLGNLLGEAASQELLCAWHGLPLRFVGGVQIARVGKSGGVCRVDTEDGQCFDAEHVIAATGLQTPGRLAQSAGLAWNNGIAVDAVTLRTNVPNIHALGDCISIDAAVAASGAGVDEVDSVCMQHSEQGNGLGRTAKRVPRATGQRLNAPDPTPSSAPRPSSTRPRPSRESGSCGAPAAGP